MFSSLPVMEEMARIEGTNRLLAEKLQGEKKDGAIYNLDEREKFLHDTNCCSKKIPCSTQDQNILIENKTEVWKYSLYEKLRGIDSSKNESVKEEDKKEEGTKKRKDGHIKMIARKKARKQSDVDSDDEHKKMLRLLHLAIGNSGHYNYPWMGDLKIMMENPQTRKMNKVTSGVVNKIGRLFTWRLYESCGVCILEFEDGIVIHILVERRYPLSKDLLQRMLDLGLEVERESFVALDLIRFIKKQIDEE
ncbi:hypothetical protein Tco_1008638 [Tanacetum coccineum]